MKIESKTLENLYSHVDFCGKMIVTHASSERIQALDINASHGRLGCLFFGEAGNSYNLASECNYKYHLVVENVIESRRFFYEHTADEISEILADARIYLGAELLSDDEICSLLDESSFIEDFEDRIDLSADLIAEKSWLLQQFIGRCGAKLGYDAVESTDEQGAVWIACCENKTLFEERI